MENAIAEEEEKDEKSKLPSIQRIDPIVEL